MRSVYFFEEPPSKLLMPRACGDMEKVSGCAAGTMGERDGCFITRDKRWGNEIVRFRGSR